MAGETCILRAVVSGHETPTVGQLGARLPDLIKEGVRHGLDGSHALLRGVLEEFGHLQGSQRMEK